MTLKYTLSIYSIRITKDYRQALTDVELVELQK